MLRQKGWTLFCRWQETRKFLKQASDAIGALFRRDHRAGSVKNRHSDAGTTSSTGDPWRKSRRGRRHKDVRPDGWTEQNQSWGERSGLW